MQLIHLLDEFLLELKISNKSERTIKTVRNNCTLFIKYVGKEFNVDSVEQLNRNHVKAYVTYKQSLGLKATYINNIIKNLRMLFNYLHQEEYISTNLMKQIKFQKESKVIIQSFTDVEVSRMIKVYSNENFLNSRNKCIMVMLFDTGIRNSELCDITMKDIMENAILIHGKGDKQRIVPISPYLQKIMLKHEQKRALYIKERYEQEYYFLSQKGKRLTPEAIERVVKVCGEQANVRSDIRCSPHTCRHTYAQMQLKNGLDVYSLSRILGHENITITKRYLQSLTDADILALAVKTSPLMNL
ncbi:tyrosine recombinase XerC [Anaerotignum neopropionicum]|uniref:Tyrosine recombinase XerC n=1 Tax=Anaerotignum neopropionicum TaxID=36847 RepID=A0A136WFW8_9FIRM|nr:tyrosine-type recombinase/integrase [Anaerotignum neopropionicum]KXL53404.1 tyrosine recombinase XerC [Anaerotignum neopropionicum]